MGWNLKMFNALKRLFTEDKNKSEVTEKFDFGDKRLAEAALMFHVIAADGIVDEVESQTLSARLTAQFGLTDAQTQQLIDDAKAADNEAIDLYGFTSILNRELSLEERIGLIENLWEMVFADGVVHELEDNIVWRVAELLHVDNRERMLLKQRVKNRLDEASV